MWFHWTLIFKCRKPRVANNLRTKGNTVQIPPGLAGCFPTRVVSYRPTYADSSDWRSIFPWFDLPGISQSSAHHAQQVPTLGHFWGIEVIEVNSSLVWLAKRLSYGATLSLLPSFLLMLVHFSRSFMDPYPQTGTVNIDKSSPLK